MTPQISQAFVPLPLKMSQLLVCTEVARDANNESLGFFEEVYKAL